MFIATADKSYVIFATANKLFGNNKWAAVKQLEKNIMGVRKLVKNRESVGVRGVRMRTPGVRKIVGPELNGSFRACGFSELDFT